MTSLTLAVCLSAPLFGQADHLPTCSGPEDPGPCRLECVVPEDAIECNCEECFSWAPSDRAEWYEVLRTNPGGTTQVVGTTEPWNHAAILSHVDPDTGEIVPEVPAIIARRWCFAWDWEVPEEGSQYAYQARSCRLSSIGPTCSAWSSTVITYVAAPYACYENGVEVRCYPGDPLTSE